MSSSSPPPPAPLSPDGRALAIAHLDHVEGQVGLAATTAGLIVAADAILLGAYVTIIKEFKVLATLFADSCNANVVWGALFCVSGALLVAGFLLALVAVFPRNDVIDPNAQGNVLFFAAVGRSKFPAFERVFRHADATGRLDQAVLNAVWGKCTFLVERFLWIRWSIRFTVAGTLLGVGVMAFVASDLPGH